MKKINIVLHTHWDREWYFTTSDSLVLMDRTFKNIIFELNKNKNISFCLDGQYSIIEEFLEINPHLEEQVKELVLKDRLFIGPWYTQTDVQLVNGESIVKNLYYGIYETKRRFGKIMDVGYLPDTFGFNNQMPEILKQACIDNIIFWRGSSYKNQDIRPYFIWNSLSNSKAKAINLVGGYGSNKGMTADDDYIDNTFLKTIENLEKLGVSNTFLLPVGNDQNEIIEDSIEVVKKIQQKTGLNIKISNYKKSIEEIFQDDLKEFSGEFREVEHTRLHKTIGSVRYEVKKSNYEVEEHLLNVAEPLVVMASILGIDISSRLLYKAWTLLFEGQAHDGICGCISDTVALDLLNRNKRALEISKSVENIVLKQISFDLGLKENEILVVNSSFKKKSKHKVVILSEFENIKIKDYTYEVINTKKVKGIKNALIETAIGNYYEDTKDYYEHTVIIREPILELSYKVFEYKQNLDKILIQKEEDIKIENSNYKITFKDNKLIFEDKKTSKLIENFIFLEDLANDGDTYDFSPLRGDKAIIINFDKAKVNLSKTMELSCKVQLPLTLEDRINPKNTEEVKFKLRLELSQDKFIKGKLSFDNKVYSHRVRLGIKSAIKDQKKSISSTPYGVTKREVLNDKYLKGWEKNNVEIPIDIETTSGFVTYETDKNKFNVFTTYAKEYQIVNDNIYMTVLATTDELGKPDLLYRPGRASGDVTKKGHVMIKTPLAQSIVKIEYDFALIYGNYNEFELYDYLSEFKAKDVSYQSQEYNKFLNRIDNKIFPFGKKKNLLKEFSLMGIKTNGVITNMSKDLDNNIILRGFSQRDHFIEINSKYFNNFKYVNLFGEEVDQPIHEYEIFNIILEEK